MYGNLISLPSGYCISQEKGALGTLGAILQGGNSAKIALTARGKTSLEMATN